ncbi:alpha/beta hydrolase fold domain-containing protein, partial [Camelimonas fluminis]
WNPCPRSRGIDAHHPWNPHSPETAGGGRTILHFHGGGYLIGSAHGSLEYAYRLANTVGGTCYTVDYRLAPEHPYPAAIDDAMAAYRALLRTGVDPATIFLSGESAGGGLAMALALALKTAGDPMPRGIIAAAPFLDLTLSGPSVRKFSQEDPAANRDTLTFMGASYFQAHEPTDPMVSPLYGDLSGLPPVYITASEGEALVDDAKRFVEKARRQGVSVTARIIEDSVHVYPIFPFLPETAAMLGEVAEWVGQVTAAHGNASASASRVA